ncbi:MAG: hypothetical protein KTR31_01890 [Myxococcales bacterium]|nr:hypothetical protein [Myxococcales bacterium]
MSEQLPSPSIELVGDWTHPRLLLRLMMVVDSPWQLDGSCFVHRDTQEACVVEMRGHDPELAERFAEGECPVRPSLSPERLQAIAEHKSVLTVSPAPGLSGRAAARAVLRCGAGLVDAGALAVRCVQSGLAHSGERFQALDRVAEGAEDEDDTSMVCEALYLAMVMPLARRRDALCTLGMALLEAPDAVVAEEVMEARALDAMESVCLRTLAGRAPEDGAVVRASPSCPAFRLERCPDSRPKRDPDRNPFGVWRLTPA